VIENGWKYVETGPGQSRKVHEFREIAHNRVEGFRACPVFEADRNRAARSREPEPPGSRTPVDEVEDTLRP
jgi:hypothetical protein